MSFNKITPWYEPLDTLKGLSEFKCEMSRADHGFLCGALRKYNPRRILEIGVAEGGTTAIILHCLAMMGSDAEVYSVDISDTLYYDRALPTGYECERLKPLIGFFGQHTTLLGKTIAGQIDKIALSGGVDFVIIDTAHRLPGEILDFLAVLPYCTENAFVLLHDINMPYWGALRTDGKYVRGSLDQTATKVLLSAVSADKYMNSFSGNIAGIQINTDTKKNIGDMFLSLTLPWAYFESNTLQEYRTLFVRHYSKENLSIFDEACRNNALILERHAMIRSGVEDMLPSPSIILPSTIPEGKRIVLYGAGQNGRRAYELLKNSGHYDIVSWVATKYSKYNKSYNIEDPKKILPSRDFDYILVAVHDEIIFDEIKQYILSLVDIPEETIVGPLLYGAN